MNTSPKKTGSRKFSAPDPDSAPPEERVQAPITATDLRRVREFDRTGYVSETVEELRADLDRLRSEQAEAHGKSIAPQKKRGA
jgi:hypothetical protein